MATTTTGMTTAIAVLPPVDSPPLPPLAAPEPPEFWSAAGADELDAAEDEAEVAATGTMAVVDALLTCVMTTVTGLVSVMPSLVADCVTTEVIMFVVGASAEADIMEVTTLVELGSTVVVES